MTTVAALESAFLVGGINEICQLFPFLMNGDIGHIHTISDSFVRLANIVGTTKFTQ